MLLGEATRKILMVANVPFLLQPQEENVETTAFSQKSRPRIGSGFLIKNFALAGFALIFMLLLSSLYSQQPVRLLSTVDKSSLAVVGDQHQPTKSDLYSLEDPPTNIPIFYNLFIQEEADVPRVSAFVREQLERNMKPGIHGPVLINSIGVVKDISTLDLPPTANATLLQHYKDGDEVNTLQELWEFCQRNDTHPKQKVVYLHSKGSFHPSAPNDQLRKYLTRGALSEQCANMPDDSCNVCSSRMSPMPHPHTSGNMWLSRCDYVRKLMDPSKFREAMWTTNKEFKEIRKVLRPCMGTDRFAVEHWVHSHPQVQPCDVDASSTYTWNYDDVPSEDFVLDLQRAPRFRPYSVYMKNVCQDGLAGASLRERLAEYAILYREAPPKDWFGWDFYAAGS